METIQIFDSNYSSEDHTNNYLFLQISSKSIAYAVFSKNENKFIGLKQYPFSNQTDVDIKQEIQTILAEDTILTQKFAEVCVQYQSFRAMLVPASLFDAKNLKSFLKFHHDVDDKDHIHFVESKLAEAFVIFSVPLYIEELIGQQCENAYYIHHSIPFINKAIKNDKPEIAPCIHIHFSNDFFDILIVKNGKIQLCNSFFYKKYSDVIYFISNILNLFSLTPESTKVILSGEIEASSEVLSEMQKMFKNIQFEKYNPDYNYSLELSTLPQHKFVNLLNLNHCE